MSTKDAGVLPAHALAVAEQNITNQAQTGSVSGKRLDVFGRIRPGTSQATRIAVDSALNRIGDGTVATKPENGKR